MKIGLVGLGKMGYQIMQRLLDGGHEVVVDQHSHAATAAKQAGAVLATDRQAMIKQLGNQPIVWLMIPAQAVDHELAALLELLPKGSIVVDGGNSDYRATLKRAAKCQAKGIELVDVGVSGGVLGLKNGFAMMAGGSADAYA